MPVSGFKRGDRVVTPAGREVTVVRVSPRGLGAECVEVRYDDGRNNRKLRAASLRFARRDG